MKNNLDQPLYYFDDAVFDAVLNLLIRQGYSLPPSVDRASLCHAFVHHAWPDVTTAVYFVKKYLV